MRRFINWLGTATTANRAGAAPKSLKTKLGLEDLEGRALMSVTLSGGILDVEGNDSANVISLQDEGSVIRVVDDGVTTFHAKPLVNLIVINGKGGNDVIRLDQGTDVPIMAVINGGLGNDEIHGGSAGDAINGEGGNDTIFGNGGNDVITGGSGNDNLYGGTGADVLNGGSGNDGLFGGIGGADTMEGGTGSDRFLVVKDTAIPFTSLMNTSDTIVDLTGIDARVTFESGTAYVMETQSVPGGVWVDGDVVRVDEALKDLHLRLGNNTFLKTDWGGELTFQRGGAADEFGKVGTADGSLLGVNWGTGAIGLTEQAFGSRAQLLSTVFHEVGHNWDDGAIAAPFRTLSGWTQDAAAAKRGGLTSASDGWFFNAGAGFTRAYAKTNPHEDFAETFSLVMMQDAGTPIPDMYDTPAEQGGTAGTSLQNKLNLVRGWVNTLVTPV